jgi:succinyl-CoA synthetase beta subunit
MEELDVEKEFFVQINNDPVMSMPVIIYARYGNMPLHLIEELYPESIHRLYINVLEGIQLTELFQVAKNLDVGLHQSKLMFLFRNLYECFIQRDCKEITISPLVLTKQGRFRAVSPHIQIEANAYFRQSELMTLHDMT